MIDPMSVLGMASVCFQILDCLKKIYKEAPADPSLILECLEDGRNLADLSFAGRSGFEVLAGLDTGYAIYAAII
jgi:hypothetical protein